MVKKVDIDIVTTTKIQATIDGKKRIVRLWRLPIPVPAIIKKHLRSYFKDAKNEALCDTRTPEEWVKFIGSFKMSPDMRAWVTSVIWFHYGGGGDCELYKYYKSFGVLGNTTGIRYKKELLAQLDEMGISKVANDLAAEREKKRNLKLSKILKWYRGGNKDE